MTDSERDLTDALGEEEGEEEDDDEEEKESNNAIDNEEFGEEANLKKKKTISTPLMIENPVRSPIVPPMRLNWASVFIFLSRSMSSKVAVSK